MPEKAKSHMLISDRKLLRDIHNAALLRFTVEVFAFFHSL